MKIFPTFTNKVRDTSKKIVEKLKQRFVNIQSPENTTYKYESAQVKSILKKVFF